MDPYKHEKKGKVDEIINIFLQNYIREYGRKLCQVRVKAVSGMISIGLITVHILSWK